MAIGQLPIDAIIAAMSVGTPSRRPSVPSLLRHTNVGVPFSPMDSAIAMLARRRSSASGASGPLSFPACQAATI